MKKTTQAIMAFALIIAILSSNKSFSQNSKDASTLCTNYPTSDAALNQSINDLLTQNEGFDARFGLIYAGLSPVQQQQVNSYLQNGDETLFTAFPQFNDEELKSYVTRIRNKYITVANKHTELFPKLDSRQRDETVKAIITCAAGKGKVDKESLGSQRMAVDICETMRVSCISSVATQAAAMHVGCAVADLTFFGGIICHATAFAYQWAAGNNCNLDAQKCRDHH